MPSTPLPLLAALLCLLSHGRIQAQIPSAELIHFTVDGKQGSAPLLPGFLHESVWSGLGMSSAGDLYIAVSNHQQPEGNVALFKYAPSTGQIRLLGDVKSISTGVQNWMPQESQYKVHTFLLEHADGKIYFATDDHEPSPFLRGAHLYTIDSQTDAVTDFSKTQPSLMTRSFDVIPNPGTAQERSGVFIEYYGIKGIGLNPQAPDDLYAMTYPEGHLIHYDLATGAMTKVGQSTAVSYVFYVDEDGNVFYARPVPDGLELVKYERATGSTVPIGASFPGIELGAIAPTASGDVVYVLVADTKEIYRLEPGKNELEYFTTVCGSNSWRLYNLTLDPYEGGLYYVSNNNSRSTIRRIDLATKVCAEILDVNALLGTRDLCFGGVNTWDDDGHFYAPVWTWEGHGLPADVALLKVRALAPGRYVPFGIGCAGSAGTPTLQASPGSSPWIDETFTLELGNLPPNADAFAILGFSDTDWAGMSLPADLTQFGIQGCTAFVSADFAFPVTASGGMAQWSVQIPNDGSLLGLRFYNQGLVLDPGVNSYGAVMTNAAEGIVGIR